MLTGRGRRTLLLGAGLYLVAWGFGTAELFPIAIGLFLAVAAAWLWVRTISRPMRLRRRTPHGELVEGGTATIGLEVAGDGGPLPGRAVVLDRVGDLGVRRGELERDGGVLRGAYRLEALPRGRYRLHDAVVRVGDPFGLAETELPLERSDVLLVYPRVSELETVFTEGGLSGDSSHALLHRTSGYDLHSIRDYQHGESLRRVHWPSTAKRRRLMVKELVDSPRDEATVVLDCDAQAVAGPPGESSFDVQVRAAASLLHRIAADGQRCSLLVHGALRRRQRIGSGGGEWMAALAELAAVRADADRSLASFLAEVAVGGSAGEALDALQVLVVTAALSPALAERLLALRSAQRAVAVVWVDAATFAGRRPPAGTTDGVGLMLVRLGVPLARVRAGDDLGVALAGAARIAPRAVAHA